MEKNDWSTEISQLEEFFVSAQIVIPLLIHILRLQKKEVKKRSKKFFYSAKDFLYL